MPPSQPADHLLGAAFGSSLHDTSGQNHLIINSSSENQLIWNLKNNATGPGQDLCVTPFGSVSKDQYHFAFTFSPGALTAAPAVEGWDVDIEDDGHGGVKTVYVALSGTTPLDIAPGQSKNATWTYANAIQENPNSSAVSFTVTCGTNVTLGGSPISPTQGTFGPFDLTLVPPGTASLSAPPISVDFVGRRTVLNDGKTQNSFTFALTNLTSQDIPLTPKVEGRLEGAPTIFTVWFDAAPNDPDQEYPWALARLDQLDAQSPVALSLPSADWQSGPPVSKTPQAVTGNRQWALTVTKPVSLPPQSPLFFTFSGIVTQLAPGFTRMYLRYQNLGDFADGFLVAELEKSPLLYGTNQGQGLYLSAGNPATPHTLDFEGGLYIDQFADDKPAATLSGGTGLVVSGTSALQGETTVGTSNDPSNLSVLGTLAVAGQTTLGKAQCSGSAAGYYFGDRENPDNGESWAWYASGGNARLWSGTDKLAVTPDGSVGIGTTLPSDRLDVGGNLRILTGSNPVRFTSAWSGFPDNATNNNQAEISNDTGQYQTLMIVGNKSAGMGRRVGIWDRLEVNGSLNVKGGDESFTVSNGFYYFYVGANRGGGSYCDIGAVYFDKDHPPGWWVDLVLQREQSWGNVGIGTTQPKQKLDVAGNINCWKLYQQSDARAKSNVAGLTDVLDKLGKIRGVSFERAESGGPATRSSRRREIGVIAQEVERAFPELVSTHGDEEFRAVDYSGLTSVLVEAAKELLARNEELRCRVEALEGE